VRFNKDAELDPRLSGVALTALFTRYEEQYAGSELAETLTQHAQAPVDSKTALRVGKAIKAALADLELLISRLSSDGNSDEVPADVGNDLILLEIYWRLHENWNAETAPAVKMINLMGMTPVWTDLAAMFDELSALDHDGSDPDSVPTEWYEDLLARFDARVGKTKVKKAPKKAAIVVKEPPPDAVILDYSTKSTFLVGQWVRHPKFGVGYVIESGQHVTLEFGPDRKILAHVAAVATPAEPTDGKRSKSKSTGDTAALARAAGIDIVKVPGRFDQER
jgi:hypothetical protein